MKGKNEKASTAERERDAFWRYETLRRSGVINMCDARRGAELSGLAEEAYLDILFNYGRYSSAYGESV